MDLTKASKKYQEYCRADTHQPESHKKTFLFTSNLGNHYRNHKYFTLRSLLLVRKSVEGFRMAVMALASSSCTVRVVLEVNGSVLNTNWRGHIKRKC